MTKKTFYEKCVSGPTEKFIPKRRKEMTVEFTTISAQQAKHILKHYNKKNRKLSPAIAKKYIADMSNNEWEQNGDTLRFDREGILLDGQHRLAGQVESDTEQAYIIIYGLKPEVFDSIDNGKSRTNTDVIAMKGYENASSLSSLVRSIIGYENCGTLDVRLQSNFGKGVRAITKKQILNYLEDHPEIMDYTERFKKSPVVCKSYASFCYWLLSSVDKECAEDYLDMVLMGNNLQEGTIERYMFNKLLRNKNAKQNKLTKTAIIANVILGWRRYMGWSKSKAMQISWDSRNDLPSPTEKG